MNQQISESQNSFIENNLNLIHGRIKKACKKSGRNPEDVRLMLVTKTVPAEFIRFALESGEKLLGENVASELKSNYTTFHAEYNPEFHFIGFFGDDEMDTVLPYADCIQTIDRIDLAVEMNRKLQAMDMQKDILIQVNTSRKESHFGISPEHAIGLVLKAAKLPSINIKGLMTLGVFDTTEEKARSCFQLLKNLFDEIKMLAIPGVQMEILSMGMSDYLEAAIEEGSTMIRIGTAIFGERETPDSFYWNEK